jgi:hypothetical protein
MGKVLKKKLNGMGWRMKTSLILLLSLTATIFMYQGWHKPAEADAAIGVATAWTSQYGAVAYPTGVVGSAIAKPSGTNRMLVVAIGSTAVPSSYTTPGGFAQTVTVSYGGQPLSLAVGDPSATTVSEHTYLYYLKDAGITAATNTNLSVTITSAGTSYYNNVYAAIYTGVDQSATPYTAVQNRSAALTATTFTYTSGLAAAVGDEVIEVMNIGRNSSGTTTRTVTWPTTATPIVPAWAATPTDANPTGIATSGVTMKFYVHTRGLITTGGTDTLNRTASSASAWVSMSGMSLKAYTAPSDTTPPIAGTVIISPDISSTYTSAAPSISTTFTDAESAVTSCQYTTNGTTWVAGAVSGAASPYTCSANPTGLTGFLNINMRATSTGGTTTATQIQRTVDNTVPTDGILTVTKGNAQNSISWTAATDNGGGSISSYILRYSTGATAPANCSTGTAVTGSPFTSAILSTLHTGLTNGTQYSYRLCATDSLGNTSGGVTGSATPVAQPPSTITSCNGCHGNPPVDGTARNVPVGQFQGSHTLHSATCTICHIDNGTNLKHADGIIKMAANINNTGGAYSKTASFAVSNAPFSGGTCSATFCHGQGAPTWGASAAAPVNGFPYSSVQCSKCHSGNLAGDVTAVKPFYSTAILQVIAATDAKVGAHTPHLAATDSLTNALVCADCHGTVTLATATHMNGTTNFIWSTLATKNGALVPTYTAGVCANVYCHGASMPGGDTTGTNRAPTWNSTTYLPATIGTGGTACKTCHGFPPLPASGHPTLTTAVPATFGNGTTAIGTSCSCHANISTTGTTYANIFVNKALHIDGTLQVTGGHAVPYDTHKADVVAAGGNTACLGCHAMGTAASPYPAAVVGNPPDCMSCHQKAAPVHTGTVAGANCSSCHGLSTATTTNIGRPVGTAYPDRLGYHGGAQDGAHGTAACTVCHNGAGTTSGNNSGINHGKGSTAGPVRNGKPNVVGPMVNGITPTTSAKGVGTPANGTTCVHGTISSGCSGGGTQTNRW